MAYTYNIPVTVRGGRRAVWDGYWDGSGAYEEQVVGIIGGAWYQSSMMFNNTPVAGKTITGITLNLTVASGTIPSDGTQNYPICDKADSSTTSWKRSSTSAVNGKYIRNQTVGGGTISANNTVLSIDMGTTLPTYGYVAGPRASSLSSSFKHVKLASTATLAVTTNETYREYTLTYNANGGSGAPGNQAAGVISVDPSCTFTVSSTIPTRTGYTFLGWSTSSTATSASYVGGSQITVSNGTTTLYAVWKLQTYTVTYDKGPSGTGTNTTATKTYNVALTLKGATFTRTGYTQTSWYSTSPAQAFALGGSYTANADITLYPTWTPNKYTVSYNANAGTGVVSNVPDAQTKTYGTALTLSSTKPTRANEPAGSRTVLYDGNGAPNPTSSTASRTTSYAFSNWNTAANGSGTAYSSGASYTANAAATLYAQWTSTTTTASVTLPTITRTGYRFDGWFTAQTGGSQVTSPFTPGNDVVTLYAHWTALSATLSSVSPTTVLCGNTLTGSWTSTGSYYYRLKVTCGNGEEKWSSITSVGATSAAVTIPTTWYSMSNGPMKNSETASATCTLYTYSNSAGTTQVGTATSLPFTAKVPDSVVPTLSSLTYKASSDNPVVSSWGENVFVQGYSKVTLTLSVSSYNGSALKSVSFSGANWGSTGLSLTSQPSTVINMSGPVTFTAYCTDTRNHQSHISVDVTFEAYSPPTISAIAVGRSDKSGNDNNSSGAWIKFTPSFSYSSCGGHNQLSTHTAQYTLHGSSAVLGSLTCTSDTTYAPENAEATPPTGTIWPVSATSAYDVSVILVDSIQANAGTNTTLTTTLPSVQGIWYGKGNDRLGLGGVPTGPGLHVDWDAEFNGVVDVTQRRCYNTLPSAGWYRVLTFNSDSVNHSNGYAGSTIDFNIGYKGPNETHKISLHIVNGRITFDSENSVSYSQLIDKIRYARNGAVGYVDLHILGECTGLYVDFIVHDQPTKQYQYVAAGLVGVDPSPVYPETVVTEYTFSLNTVNQIISDSITFTTTTGYYIYQNTAISYTSKVFVQVTYSTGIGTQWQVVTQKRPGDVVLYVRNASDGSRPADGTSINADILIIN